MNIIRLLHRLAGSGGAGSPATVQPAGVVAINFDVAGTKEMWASDGAAWHRLNPPGSVPFATAAQVITGTSTTDAVNPASLAGAAAVVSAGAADAGKYVRLDAAGLVDDTVVPKATGAAVIAGTATDSFITPAAMEAASVVTSAGAADAGKYITLDANGKLDASILNIDAMEFKGTTLPTGAAPATPGRGDVWVVTADGVMGAGWTGATGTAMQAGDQLIFDGAAWQIVGGAQINPDAYIPLAGTAGVAGAALTSGAVITFNPAAANAIVMSGSTAAGTFGAVQRFLIDCGTY